MVIVLHGGAMNVAAISFFQEWSGHEFVYVDWVVRILPFFILTAIVALFSILLLHVKGESWEGTKDYFEKLMQARNYERETERSMEQYSSSAMISALPKSAVYKTFHHWSLLIFFTNPWCIVIQLSHPADKEGRILTWGTHSRTCCRA